jgi:hypothetical protein
VRKFADRMWMMIPSTIVAILPMTDGQGADTPTLTASGDRAWLMLHGARGDRMEVDIQCH